MNITETLDTFFGFYSERGHERIPGGSLLPPPGDPVLFTTSGMHPLTPYLEGKPHPRGKRLVNVQRCLRTTDLDQVGDSSHLTLFEMLGTWSLGDYEGSRSLRWGHQLLSEGFGIEPKLLHVTVFGGDHQVGPDLESSRTWEELGLPVEMTQQENWWSNGPTGPCGPDTEIFVWTGDGRPDGTPTTDSRWVEVWNHVMMRFRRHVDGSLQPLEQPSVDTGLGLERLLTTLQRKPSVYECDIFEPWISEITSLWPSSERSTRLICDHLRSSIVVVGQGVRPSNSGRGYVLRRLVRRTLTAMWREDSSRTLTDLPIRPLEHTINHFGPEIEVGLVRQILLGEERRFRQLLDRGRRVIDRYRPEGPLGDEDFCYLHETHGLPPDLVRQLLDERLRSG